jgi:hypothetical protein
MEYLDTVSYGLLLLVCATWGLAPFLPEPHIWEKLKMLRAGTLKRPLDWFDLLAHAAPFAILAAKLIRDSLT